MAAPVTRSGGRSIRWRHPRRTWSGSWPASAGIADAVVDLRATGIDEALRRRVHRPAPHAPAVLAGLGSVGQAASVPWGQIGVALGRLRGADTIADCGRFALGDGVTSLLSSCDALVLVAGSTLRAARAASRVAPLLRDELGVSTDDMRVSVLVVGPGEPYSTAEVASGCNLPLARRAARDPRSAAVWCDGAQPGRAFERSATAARRGPRGRAAVQRGPHIGRCGMSGTGQHSQHHSRSASGRTDPDHCPAAAGRRTGTRPDDAADQRQLVLAWIQAELDGEARRRVLGRRTAARPRRRDGPSSAPWRTPSGAWAGSRRSSTSPTSRTSTSPAATSRAAHDRRLGPRRRRTGRGHRRRPRPAAAVHRRPPRQLRACVLPRPAVPEHAAPRRVPAGRDARRRAAPDRDHPQTPARRRAAAATWSASAPSPPRWRGS